MSKARFKKGDKVKILDGSKIKNYTFNWADSIFGGMPAHIGQIATIDEIIKHSSGRYAYTVKEFPFKWDERGLAPVNNETIVIYRKDNEIIAINKITGKTATAKCSPDDDFDFETGAKLAFRRLMRDKQRPKFKIGDRVIGTAEASKHYGVTKQGWKGRITNIRSDGKIVVDGSNGDGHWVVNGDYFELDTSPEYFNGKVVCIESSPFTTKGKIYEIKGGFGHFDDGTKFTAKPVTSVADLNKHMTSQFLEVVE